MKASSECCKLLFRSQGRRSYYKLSTMATSYEISMHAAMAAAAAVTALSELDFNFTLNKIQPQVPKAFLSGRRALGFAPDWFCKEFCETPVCMLAHCAVL